MTTDFDKTKNNRKDCSGTDLLMDAIGGIDPRYIEEARQAVSPDRSGKKLPIGWKKKLIHSPVPILAAAACLTILVLAGASRAGLLQNLLIYAPKNSMLSGEVSLSDSMSDESEYAAEEAAEKDRIREYTADKNAGGENAAEKNADGENAAGKDAAEKEAVSETQDNKSAAEPEQEAEQLLTAPPSLTLLVSDSSSSGFSVLKTSYSWIRPGSADGDLVSTICDADQVWAISDLPVLSLKSGSTITPDFGDAPPDSFSVRCLAASDLPDDDPQQNCVSAAVQEDGTFTLPIKDRPCIVEITAEWDKDLYSGSCIYGFRAEYVE